MVDSLTNNFGLVLPQTGGDLNVWGTTLNNGLISALDNLLGANLAVSITTIDVTLTQQQFGTNAVFVVSGALTGDRNLIVPLNNNSLTVACGGKFIVVNNTTGAHNLTVKTAASGSTGVTVPQGFAASLYSDTVNVGYAFNGAPAYALASNGNPNGQLAGTAASTNTNASLAYDYVNNILYVCTTTGNAASAVWTQPTVTILRGFDTAINLQINATVSSNNLTVALKAANTGLDPTALNPITVLFRDATLTNGFPAAGDPVTVNVTGALSISTILGATLGSQNSVPFRFWIVLFNNGGSPVLGLINCSTTTSIRPLNESGVASTTQMTSGSTSAGIFYTPNGVTVTNKAFRIIGFLTYESALVTAGTYNNAPDVVALFGPGVKKPGDIIQSFYASTTTATTSTNPSFVTTNLSVTLSPTSKVSLLRVAAYGSLGYFGGASSGVAQIYRNTTSTMIGSSAVTGLNPPGPAGVNASASNFVLDAPGTTGSTVYGVAISSLGSNSINYPASNGFGPASPMATMTVDEIMG